SRTCYKNSDTPGDVIHYWAVLYLEAKAGSLVPFPEPILEPPRTRSRSGLLSRPGGHMRRTVAIVLIALGVFCLVLAPMMRTWMATALMKTPMDYYSQQVATAQVDYFDIGHVGQVEVETVEAHLPI